MKTFLAWRNLVHNRVRTLVAVAGVTFAVVLVFMQEFSTREEALTAERQLKGWNRAKKKALLAGDWKKIQQLAWGTRNPVPAHLQ